MAYAVAEEHEKRKKAEERHDERRTKEYSGSGDVGERDIDMAELGWIGCGIEVYGGSGHGVGDVLAIVGSDGRDEQGAGGM